MKISTRAHYGLRAMVTIAQRAQETARPQSVAEIAQIEELPENYLEQLIGSLRRNGLLTSFRGARGGYLPAKPPSEISVLEVLKASGEQLRFPECTVRPEGCDLAVARGKTCACAVFWRKMNSQILDLAENTSLQDLIDAEKADHSGH